MLYSERNINHISRSSLMRTLPENLFIVISTLLLQRFKHNFTKHLRRYSPAGSVKLLPKIQNLIAKVQNVYLTGFEGDVHTHSFHTTLSIAKK